MNSKDLLSDDKNKQSTVWIENGCVKKKSKCVDFVTENEIFIAKKLNSLNLINFVVLKNTSQDKNNFDQYISEWEFLDGPSFYEFLLVKNVDCDVVFNCIKQVIFAIFEAYEKLNFIHGDLHYSNIKLIDTDLESISYSFNNKITTLPLKGKLVKIFDFGDSNIYNKDCENNYIKTNMFVFDQGYINIINDPFFDLRIFLYNSSSILFSTINSLQVTNFRLFVENFFTKYTNHFNGKILPDEDILFIDTIIEIVNDCCQKFKGKTVIHNGQYIMDFVGLLTCICPLKLCKEKFKKNFVTNEFIKKFNLFLSYWVNFEKFFEKKHVLEIFKKVVNFVITENKNDKSIEGKFNNFLFNLLRSVGQNMVSINLKDSSLLYHSLAGLSETLSNLIYINIMTYKEYIRKCNRETIEMFEIINSNDSENFQDIFIKIMNKF